MNSVNLNVGLQKGLDSFGGLSREDQADLVDPKLEVQKTCERQVDQTDLHWENLVGPVVVDLGVLLRTEVVVVGVSVLKKEADCVHD